MQNSIHHALRFAGLALIFAAGCAAGHYHGKAETLERVYEKQINVGFNPVNLEKMR